MYPSESEVGDWSIVEDEDERGAGLNGLSVKLDDEEEAETELGGELGKRKC